NNTYGERPGLPVSCLQVAQPAPNQLNERIITVFVEVQNGLAELIPKLCNFFFDVVRQENPSNSCRNGHSSYANEPPRALHRYRGQSRACGKFRDERAQEGD